MIRARASWSRFSNRSFCSKFHIPTDKNSNNCRINGDSRVESDLRSYNEAYKQLNNLNFMISSLNLPRKRNLGRGAEKEGIHEKILELQTVKTRLDKLEETIKEIAIESRKQSGSDSIKKDSEKGQEVDKTKHEENTNPSNMGNAPELSKSMNIHLSGEKIVAAPVFPKGRANECTSRKDAKHENHGGGSSLDAKR